jgi:hypothetical protein
MGLCGFAAASQSILSTQFGLNAGARANTKSDQSDGLRRDVEAAGDF